MAADPNQRKSHDFLTLDAPYTQAFEWSAGNAIYKGRARAGTAKADAKWQIQKITYDGSNNATDIQWASGSADFAFVWNDRGTYTYS